MEKIGIAAGTQSFKYFFYQLAACYITKRYSAKKDKAPPPAPFKIQWNKDKKKKIKGRPAISTAQKRHDIVKERIALMVVDLYKKPSIPLF